MSRHVYLRAYMAGIALPTMAMVLVLAFFCVVRLGLQFSVPIERALVFPMALVPNLWGLWNMLYVVVRRRRAIPIGVFGALVPLIIGPLALLVVLTVVPFHVPHAVLEAFPFGLGLAIAGYYLIWKYLIGYFNRLLEVG
jgi:hypothetical protein